MYSQYAVFKIDSTVLAAFDLAGRKGSFWEPTPPRVFDKFPKIDFITV
jgi:hypothetical protein